MRVAKLQIADCRHYNSIISTTALSFAKRIDDGETLISGGLYTEQANKTGFMLLSSVQS